MSYESILDENADKQDICKNEFFEILYQGTIIWGLLH